MEPVNQFTDDECCDHGTPLIIFCEECEMEKVDAALDDEKCKC